MTIPDDVEVPPPSGEPLLSIVVPIYNVEAYLDECLESIIAQAVQDFEVIMVDDGSTDASGDIANGWARKDQRFRLIRQENHGLGHARNSGVPYARGRYIAFLDSDDRVPTGAYRRMIDVLERSGSDFATGNVHRFDSSGRTWQAPLYRGMAKSEQTGSHVTHDHELLRDHLAHNKVWRTSFWIESKLQFPVGVLYEDVPTTIPAHVLAKAVDVVPVVAVLWRVRDQGDSSITQSRGQDARHLTDRVAGVLTVSRFIGHHVGHDLKDEYDALVLRRDLRWYVDLYPEVDEYYQRKIFTEMNRFLAQVSPTALRKTPTAMRVAYGLLSRNQKTGFEEYVTLRRADKANDLAIVVNEGRALVEVPVAGGESLPEEVRDATDELTVASRVSRLAVEDGLLVIDGWAHVERVAVDQAQEIEVFLFNDRESISAELVYRRGEDGRADSGVGSEGPGTVAFSAKFSLRKLRPSLVRRMTRRVGTVSWRAKVMVTTGGITSLAALTKPTIGAAERPLMTNLGGDIWLRAYWSKEGLVCSVSREGATLQGIQAGDDSLKIMLRVHNPPSPGAQVRIRSQAGAHNVSIKGDPHNRHQAIADVKPLILPDRNPDRAEHVANLYYRESRVRRWRRLLEPTGTVTDVVRAAGAEYIIRRTRAGAADLVNRENGPEITALEWSTDASLVVRMRKGSGIAPDALQLRAAKQEEYLQFSVKERDGELYAELPLGRLPKFGEEVPLRSGTWDLAARRSAATFPVRIGGHLIHELPRTVSFRGRTYSVSDRGLNTLSVVVGSELLPEERGRVNQEWLRTSFYPSARGELQDVVLFESYYGKQFSDSPREVYRELRRRNFPAEFVVAVRDQQFNLPPDATPVPYRSRKYYELLAQAKFVVANTHLPNCFRRAEGQTVLQTWHGVGTKKIGLDMDAVHFANKSYIDNIRGGEAGNWDYLVSPNPFTSPIMRRAFAFNGDLLETGAPRNDIFHKPDRDEIADEVKRRLGIHRDRKVVMYAPTWRDNQHDGPGRYRLDLKLDLYDVARKLGDEYVLMFRKHSNIIDGLPAGDGEVVDVSDYPEVQELLLITDILISDYSTLMCDFANTGRPMLFYTYDLVNYRDVLRGFYFDFEKSVPGPLIADEADIVPAILSADSVRAEYSDRYASFIERFCFWDDGQATERVVDAVFGEGF